MDFSLIGSRSRWDRIAPASKSSYAARTKRHHMVVLNRIYTRTGDDGTTVARLRRPAQEIRSAGRRLRHARRGQRRDRPRAAAHGGRCGARSGAGAHPERPVRRRGRLCLSEKGPGGARLTVTDAQVAWIEGEIDRLNADLAPLRSFILPGGSAAAAYMHLARTVCRRAERIMVRIARPAGRDRHRRFAEIRQPAVRFPVRRRPPRQRQGRARRALGAGAEPVARHAACDVGGSVARHRVDVAPSALADPMSDLTKDRQRRLLPPRLRRGAPEEESPPAGHLDDWFGSAGSDDMRSGNTGLALTRRSDPQPLFLAGDCSWGNFDGPPVHWMPSFTKKVGAGCVTLAVPDVFPEASSAKEGGGVILDPAADGKTMIVHLDDSPSMVQARRPRWKIVPLKLGRRRPRLSAAAGRRQGLRFRQGGCDDAGAAAERAPALTPKGGY